MALLLGSKWTVESREKVNLAVKAGQLPEAEYTLGSMAPDGCYVVAYQRPPGRGPTKGTISFYSVGWMDGNLAVSRLDALPRETALPIFPPEAAS